MLLVKWRNVSSSLKYFSKYPDVFIWHMGFLKIICWAIIFITSIATSLSQSKARTLPRRENCIPQHKPPYMTIVSRKAWFSCNRKNRTIAARMKSRVRYIFLDQSDPMFYKSYLGGGLLISVCFPDVHFLRTKRAFLRAKPHKSLGWWLIQMADLHFRLCVSVYKISKIIHGRFEIWSSSSRVQFDLPFVTDQTEHSKINSISPHAHVLFSIYHLPDRNNILYYSHNTVLSFHHTQIHY